MYLNSLYILYFYMILRKQMNRTNSLIILVAIILGTFLVFNITTIPMINVSASGEEQEYYYPPEPEEYYYPPLMDGYDPSELPEYIPRESYGDGSYDHYESGYYEEQGYGIPYDIK